VRRERRLGLLGGAVLLAAAIVGLAILLSQSGGDDEPANENRPVREAQSGEGSQAPLPQDGITLGDPDAPTTLIEFADLQCPFCAQYALEGLPAVVNDFVRDGRLKLELRLLTFLGPDSVRGARMAGAAALQDRMWEFSELFFAAQGPENTGYATDEFLRAVARRVPGLDVQQAFADRASPEVSRLLADARRAGDDLGLEGTPSFYIRRGEAEPELLELSAVDADTVTAAIEDALGGG
jgi:protein-disulfide isomerase